MSRTVTSGFTPLAQPIASILGFPYKALLISFSHEHSPCSRAYDIQFLTDCYYITSYLAFIRIFPGFQTRSANDLFAAYRNRWQFRASSDFAVDEFIDLGFRASKLGGYFFSCNNCVVHNLLA